MHRDRNKHPCFSATAQHSFGRIHLPVAPECNVQCKFCNRAFDCVNESRPGVTSALLTPVQALHYCKDVIARRQEIAVAGIAGPGDPFATPERTLETFSLIRAEFPEMLLCVASNGLNLAPFIPELAALDVSHVTVTVNGIDPETVDKVYSWYRQGKRMLHGRNGASILISQQLEAIRKLREFDITVKVNTILIPGINDTCIAKIAETVAAWGANLFNCIPLIPAAGSEFEHVEEPSKELVAELREEAQKFLPQMKHCTRCRADAIGFLGENIDTETVNLLKSHAAAKEFNRNAARIAVATLEGVMVNQHLGNAMKLSIYENSPRGPVFVEERTTPPMGSGNERWHSLAKTVDDCHTILVQFAGTSPREILAQHGIEVLCMEGRIAPALADLFAGRPLPSYMTVKAPQRCGEACGGNGGGCG